MAEVAQMQEKSLVCPVCNSLVSGGGTSCPQCEEDLTGLVLLDNVAPSMYNEGLSMVQQGRLDEAMEHLLAALAHDPRHVPALVVLGKISAQREHYDQAISYWRRALELDSENVAALAGIGKAQRLRVQQLHSRRLRVFAVPVAIAALVLLAGALLNHQVSTPNQAPVAGDIAAATAAVGVVDATFEATAIAAATPPGATPTATQALMLAESVQQALSSDPGVGSLGIVVRQIGAAIQLSGQVPNQYLKTTAEVLAKGIRGVEAVDSTNLVITPPALVEQARSLLRADPNLKELDLGIDQVGSGLKLTGLAPSAETKARLIAVVRTVAGLELVDAEGLTIAPSSLAEEVRQALLASNTLASLDIQVSQYDSGIRLEGTVETAEQKILVEDVTRAVKGVMLVDSSALEVEPPFEMYTVQPGDSLSAIAGRFYGDVTKWFIIFEANQDRVTQPELIEVGTILRIPKQS